MKYVLNLYDMYGVLIASKKAKIMNGTNPETITFPDVQMDAVITHFELCDKHYTEFGGALDKPIRLEKGS